MQKDSQDPTPTLPSSSPEADVHESSDLENPNNPTVSQSDQSLITDPVGIEGGGSSNPEDPVEDGSSTYFPPTDPVIATDRHGKVQVLGGFSATSDQSAEVEASASDAEPGDEALADAVRRELREDAATTDLAVEVEVNRGVVYLRGSVDGPEDAENAEEVAGRVAGVVEVVEELDIPGL